MHVFYNAHGFGEETRLDLALLVQGNHILGLEQVKQLFLGILVAQQHKHKQPLWATNYVFIAPRWYRLCQRGFNVMLE